MSYLFALKVFTLNFYPQKYKINGVTDVDSGLYQAKAI